VNEQACGRAAEAAVTVLACADVAMAATAASPATPVMASVMLGFTWVTLTLR
jgi:hypothetical protein